MAVLIGIALLLAQLASFAFVLGRAAAVQPRRDRHARRSPASPRPPPISSRRAGVPTARAERRVTPRLRTTSLAHQHLDSDRPRAPRRHRGSACSNRSRRRRSSRTDVRAALDPHPAPHQSRRADRRPSQCDAARFGRASATALAQRSISASPPSRRWSLRSSSSEPLLLYLFVLSACGADRITPRASARGSHRAAEAFPRSQ